MAKSKVIYPRSKRHFHSKMDQQCSFVQPLYNSSILLRRARLTIFQTLREDTKEFWIEFIRNGCVSIVLRETDCS